MIHSLLVASLASLAASMPVGSPAPRVMCGTAGYPADYCLPDSDNVRLWLDAMVPNSESGQGYHSPHHGQTATWYDQSPNGNNAVAKDGAGSDSVENSCYITAMGDDHGARCGNCRGHPVVGCIADVPDAETQVLTVTGPVLTSTRTTIYLVAGTTAPTVTGTNTAPINQPGIMRAGDGVWVSLDDDDGVCLYTQDTVTPPATRTKKCWTNPYRQAGTDFNTASTQGPTVPIPTAAEQVKPGNLDWNSGDGGFVRLDLYVFDVDLADVSSADLYRPFAIFDLEGTKGTNAGTTSSQIHDILRLQVQSDTGDDPCFGCGPATVSTAVASAWSDAGWLIGSGSVDTQQKGNNFIAEVIVYDGASARADREILSSFLINKWNLNEMDCTCNDFIQNGNERCIDGIEESFSGSLYVHQTINCPACGICGDGDVGRGESCDSTSGGASGPFGMKAACAGSTPGSCGGCSSTCQLEHCPGYGGAFWLYECSVTQYSHLTGAYKTPPVACQALPDGHPCEAWEACPVTPFELTSLGCAFVANGENPPSIVWHVANHDRLASKKKALLSKEHAQGLVNSVFNQSPSGFKLVWATHGLITGDPHFTSFSGGTYEILGQPFHFYNLISTPELEYNAQFVPGGHNSTWIGAVGLVYNGHTVSWSAETNEALLDGKSMEVSTDKSSHQIMLGNNTYVSFVQAKHPAPTRMIIRVPGFTVRLTRKQVSKVQYVPHGAHVKRQGNDKSYHWGARPWYFDQHVMRMPTEGASKDIHGLIGQTASFTRPVKSHKYHGRSRDRNGEGVIEGQVTDYEVSGLLKADSKFSMMQ